MRNVTSAFMRALADDKRDYICTATITLAQNLYNANGSVRVVEGKRYRISGTYTSVKYNGSAITITNGYFTAPTTGLLVVVGGNTTTVIRRVLDITNDNIWENGFKIEDAVSSDNVFEIGAAIINQGTIVLNNIYDEFSEFEFDGASVVMYVALADLDNNTTETIKMGTYVVDEPKYNGSIITLTCLDYMSLFDKPYTSHTGYPATLYTIITDACTKCGVTFASSSSNFPHKDFEIPYPPSDESTTYRQAVSWAAQIAGCFARVNSDGELEIKFYDFDALEEVTGDSLDGGTFDDGSPSYTSGDTADGGTFNPWNTGDVADGGSFTGQSPMHVIASSYSHTLSTDDVVVTGIRVIEKVDTSNVSDYADPYDNTATYSVGARCVYNNNLYECITAVTSAEEFNQDKWQQLTILEYNSGADGYVIAIEGNDLIHGKTGDDFNGQLIATHLGADLIGVKFRKASITHPNNPSMEAGDVALFIDRKGNQYPIIMSSTIFSVGDSQNTTSSAETPKKNSDRRYSQSTRNYVEMRKNLVIEQNFLENKLANASGLYSTDVAQPGGGTITYYHDKPNLSESNIAMMFTDVGFSLTANYQDTTPTWYGMTVDGQFIASKVDTVALFFNYAHGGTLKLGGASDVNGVLEIYDSSNSRVGRWDNSGLYIGNISSDLTSPNTKITTGGAITTNSLTANSYVYVNGNNQSYLNIPMSNSSAFTRISSDGFCINNRNNDEIVVNANNSNYRGLWVRPINQTVAVQQGVNVSISGVHVYPTNGNSFPNADIYSDSISLWSSTGSSNYKVFYAYTDDSTSPTRHGVFITGDLNVSGFQQKNKIVDTQDYNSRALSCYETPTPMYGDVGEGVIGDDGYCYVTIDPIFRETISDTSPYQVFLQKYGLGECYVHERKYAYFVVAGEPGLSFGWEIKAKQLGADQIRLRVYPHSDTEGHEEKIDYANEALIHIQDIQRERGITQ